LLISRWEERGQQFDRLINHLESILQRAGRDI
jgi:hypothetical protein